MRRIVWSIAVLLGLPIAAFAAMAAFPQISEKIIEMSCSMTDPDEGCRHRMIAMGHTWSIKGDLERAREWLAANRRNRRTGCHVSFGLDLPDGRLWRDETEFAGTEQFPDQRSGANKRGLA